MKSRVYYLGLFGRVLQLIHSFSIFKKKVVSILIFHDLSPENMDHFEEQIKKLSLHYDFIDQETFHNFLVGNINISRHSILLSFDDGFDTSALASSKILDPLGIKALFFITTGFIDALDGGDWKKFVVDELYEGNISLSDVKEWHRPMSWNTVCQLKKKGHSIGSHTASHKRLSQVSSLEELEYEIFASKKKIQEKIGTDIIDFSYPFGSIESINKEVINLISKHYMYCYSGVRGWNKVGEDNYALKRDSAGYFFPIPYLQFLIEGGVSFYYYSRRKALEKMAAFCRK